MLNVHILKLMENLSLRKDLSKVFSVLFFFLIGKDYFRSKHCAIYSCFFQNEKQSYCSKVILQSSVINHFHLSITLLYMA